MDTVTLTSRDLDGDGPAIPVITINGKFVENTTYDGYMEITNETTKPVTDITEEIDEEKEEHQFFFEASQDLGVFEYLDFDKNSKPVGLEFSLKTKSAFKGNLIISLKHQPNKSATGVAFGEIKNAGGATDFRVIFNVEVVSLKK